MQHRSIKKLFGVLLLSLFVAGFLFQAQTRKAEAILNLSPNPGATVPAGELNYLRNADSYGNTPAYTRWGSRAGQPTVTTINNVEYGTATLNLEYHEAAAVGWPSSNPSLEAYYAVTGATANPAGVVTGAVGVQRRINFQPNQNNAGTFARSVIPFQLSPNGGFTASGVYSVRIRARIVNHFANGIWQCVAAPANFTNFLAWPLPVSQGGCNEAEFNISVYVNVLSPRDFTASPVVQTPLLTPDDESADGVSFTSGVNVSVSSGTSLVKGGTVTRKYEIRRANGSVVPIASPPDDARDLTNFTYPAVVRSGLSLQAGDRVCQIVTVKPADGQINSAGDVTSGADTTNTKEACATVVNKPYVSFYGNDVRAGGSFEGGNCNQSADIRTFYKLTDKRGAGVQLAAMALGPINQFSSASMQDSAPTGLTFANTGGGYGGSFGSSFCAPDYWSRRPSTISNANSIDLGVLLTGNYAYRQAGSTPVVISAATISNRIGVYVDGDVVIRGRIGYSNPSSWANVGDIPSLNLIVRGNIFIDSSVNELEGVYVAQPENPNVSSLANGGRFYTCTRQNGDRFTATELASNCSSRLTVTGAVVAQQVRFLRTIGSLRDATTKEPADSSNAAEIFRFSPETYLAPQPDSNLTGSSNAPKYDYYTALPPVL